MVVLFPHIMYINSPTRFLNFESNENEIVTSKIDQSRGEMGESLENLITNNRRELIMGLFIVNNANKLII